MNKKAIKTAIIGSGNIGVDLMMKISTKSDVLSVGMLVGIVPDSEGLARAKMMNIATTHEGLDGLRKSDIYDDIQIVFDATSAYAHKRHSDLLIADGKQVIDLTPAAIGPYVVPPVNSAENLDAQNINMVTCGGQATVPIVAAVSQVTNVYWGEIVASIASKSAGPGTRANIDEFVKTTASAIEQIGGAEKGRAIIIINPAEPPLMMRDTVICLCDDVDHELITKSVEDMVQKVQAYVPGYRLKQGVQIEQITSNQALRIPGKKDNFTGLKVTVFLEVEGAGHFLPSYAGNLDIMTSAAMGAAENISKARNWI